MRKLFKIISNRNFLPLLVVIFFAVLAGRSLFFESGYLNMHDDLQIMRQLQLEKCFLDGQIPCRWVPDMGYGFGFPLFNFYPPLPYLFGQTFRVLGFSFVVTAKLTFAFSFVVSGVTMYLLAKEFFGRLGGTLSAVFYIWAPYHAVDVYVRGAMNEAWALAWFPLIFWAGYKLVTCHPGGSLRPIGSRGDSGRWNFMRLSRFPSTGSGLFAMTNRWTILLALSYFAFLTTHNLMVMIFTPFFAIWMLLHLWRNDAWHKLPSLIFSGLWALGLAAFFTLPALTENKFTQIKGQLVGYYDYTAHFVDLKQLFISRFWGYGPSVWIEAVDGMSFQIGHLHWILSLVVGGIMTVWVIRGIKEKKAIERLKKNPILLTTFYMLLVGWFTAFMTHQRSTFIYMAIPQLGMVQFSWRFLGLVIFAFSFVVGYLVSTPSLKKGFFARFTLGLSKVFRIALVGLLIMLLVVLNWNFFKPEYGKMGPLTDEEKLTGRAWDLQQTAGIYDYLPNTVDRAPTRPQKTVADIIDGEGSIEKGEQGTYWAKFNINVESEKAQVVINIFYFPGWKAYVDGVEVNTYIPDEEEWGRMWIEVPEGEHLVYVQLFNTPVRTFGNITSLISWIGLGAVVLKKKQTWI
ncbi:hypothetical protein KKB40_05675 [Patescibacteria group bacterium]|nr:hypothetical protein [Patescibacteria group bacterium]